jgi:hypothetical protein
LDSIPSNEAMPFVPKEDDGSKQQCRDIQLAVVALPITSKCKSDRHSLV